MPNNPVYGNNPYYPTYPTTPTYMPASTFQPNVQPSLINGRAVDSVEEITAGEVPLNGSLAVFPKRDGSVIYVKSTNGNGTIDTKCYVPASEDFVEYPGSTSPTSSNQVSNQDIMAAIMDIQNQVNNIKDLVKKRPGRNTKSYNQNGNKEKMTDE